MERLGATYVGDHRCRFEVWAPHARTVALKLLEGDTIVPLHQSERGYFSTVRSNISPGSLYLYQLDGGLFRPDPASRSQPDGVHGPSQVVSQAFAWSDAGWRGLPLQKFIQYELHVGTFTTKGTFDAITEHLDELVELGITAIEIMPVGQFPGERNWGYDGVYPYAVQNSYGGVNGLKALVNDCHRRGLAVVLDVVYNHLGPEGNYFGDFGPYFTDRYRTPWGQALNFDGPMNDEVRRFFIENALYWITEFHIDALRLDAVHAIMDQSAHPFLEELGIAVHQQAAQLNRHIHLIPESAANDARVIRSRDGGGLGLDAQWSDDFHHALRTLLTGERTGYYQDFGELDHLTTALREGWTYAGEYSAYRQRRHGNSPHDIPAQRFVVFSQNHDQVGNRMLGERLPQLVGFDELKLAAGLVLLSPFLPLLFMGEEYAEVAPFQYFVSHSDPQLIDAVRRGRNEEFAAFRWQGEAPDPQDPETFVRSKLDRSQRDHGEHRVLYSFYKELIRLRKTVPALAHLSKSDMTIWSDAKNGDLFIRRWKEQRHVLIVCRFGKTSECSNIAVPPGRWRTLIDSHDARWLGTGTPLGGEIVSQGHTGLSINPSTFAVFESE
jgi:maltooligosyltrehalose trehalohydrolase